MANTSMNSHTAYIALGSNLGDRHEYLRQAVSRLAASAGILEVQLSPVVETEPVGGPPGQGCYLNGAALVVTTLEPQKLLELLLDIERQLGRERREQWGPRTIDLDLLLYEQEIMNTPALILPHPRMHQRLFVLQPLAAIAPDAIHPVLHQSIRQLAHSLPRTG